MSTQNLMSLRHRDDRWRSGRGQSVGGSVEAAVVGHEWTEADDGFVLSVF